MDQAITVLRLIGMGLGRTNWGLASAAASVKNFSGVARIDSDFSLRTATASGRVFYGNQFVKTVSISKLGGLAGI